jgi:hypothetical protein
MKTMKKFASAIGITSLAALPLMAGPVVTVQVPVPVVQVQMPAPAVTVDVGVPDTYVWDGVEYVGVVGGAYFYLGPGNVWLPFDEVRMARFHDWERVHVDWRDHAIRNDLYRHDVHGHDVPRQNVVQQHDTPPSHNVSPSDHNTGSDNHDVNSDNHNVSPDNHDKDKDHDH